MKLRDLFGSLFHARRKASDASSLGDNFMEKCVDADPSDLRALVASEQRSLEAEVEDAVATMRFEMRRLASRVSELDPKKVAKEIADLRSAQDDLRRLIRRCAVSAKRSHELERELELWQQRLDEAGDSHADHPRIRAEIVRSELATRGIESPLRSMPDESDDALQQIGQDSEDQAATGDDTAQEAPIEISFNPHPDTAYLVQAIREATREAERWHGYHSDDAHSYVDAIDQVRQVRDLHAALKQLDRRSGLNRDRLELAVRMRDE